jgi:hypothetical protein
VQSCLEGSLGSFTAQRRFDMDTCLFFLNERCAELRRAFGLDNVLVGVHSDEGRSPEPKTRVTPEKMRRAESTRGVGPGAGGVRWAAITIAVMDVEIIDRGLKKFTKGWDPREHGWQRPTEARGQHMIVRTEGGPGSAEVCAEIAVKQPAVRLALGPGDKEFIIEVPLKSDGSKVATAQIALDQLCKRAEAGVVELGARGGDAGDGTSRRVHAQVRERDGEFKRRVRSCGRCGSDVGTAGRRHGA